MIRFSLSDRVSGADQLMPEEVADLAAEGVSLFVNLRMPDEPQPELQAAIKKAGADYLSIPVTGGGFTLADARSLHNAVAAAEGKEVLVYCKTGSRVVGLWAAGAAQANGLSAEQAVELAKRSGPIRPGALERVRALFADAD